MNRDERRVILGWIYVAIAIACCVAGFITLLRGRIGSPCQGKFRAPGHDLLLPPGKSRQKLA